MARDNPRGSCAAASGVSPARRGFRPNIAGVAADGVIAETDRVILRQWRLDEADRFFDMHRRMEVARWIDGQPMADRAEAEPVIQRMLDRLAVDPRFGCWAVAERASRVPAGSVRTSSPCPTAPARSRSDGTCIPIAGAADWRPRPLARC